MNILVINSGSSSLKYQLFKMPVEKPLCVGLIERIGEQNAFIRHKDLRDDPPKIVERNVRIADHEEGLHQIVAMLRDQETGMISKPEEIEVVGHRVVHGGEYFLGPVVIDEEVKTDIKELFSLAPLHNPVNLQCIEFAEKDFPTAKQVAVFDTAFHQTMPEKAFLYAIPEFYYKEKDIRAYGFHGTSHRYVSKIAMDWLGKPDAKIISIHLGNGCSIAAIQGGKSVDTSMGFGPVSGLIMGTRSGDIDPSVIFHLLKHEGKTPEEVHDLLNKESGLLGLTGSVDMRDIRKALESGDKNAGLAMEMYAYRIKKYIGAYIAVLNGVDALLFTAGVGENDFGMRARICENMEYLQIHIDNEENKVFRDGIREINVPGASVKIMVVPTNEELEIARECFELLQAR
jgi:acetate kinase